MAGPTTFVEFGKKLGSKPLVYWLLWIFMGLATLLSSTNRQWSSSKLVSEAVGHWEQQLPMILEEANAWKQKQELVEPADKESLQSDWMKWHGIVAVVESSGKGMTSHRAMTRCFRI